MLLTFECRQLKEGMIRFNISVNLAECFNNELTNIYITNYNRSKSPIKIKFFQKLKIKAVIHEMPLKFIFIINT